MEHFKKEEVLARPELKMDNTIESKYLRYEGEYPDNCFAGSDGYDYVPVLYRAQPHKIKVIIKIGHGGSDER